jgi:hypothetical protein
VNTNTIPSTTSTSNGPSTTGAIGYAPDAAWLAVRRHMQMSSFDDLLVCFILFFFLIQLMKLNRSKVKKVH